MPVVHEKNNFFCTDNALINPYAIKICNSLLKVAFESYEVQVLKM